MSADSVCLTNVLVLFLTLGTYNTEGVKNWEKTRKYKIWYSAVCSSMFSTVSTLTNTNTMQIFISLSSAGYLA